MYTPTTEEVRENYGWNGTDSYIKSNREASRAEFDRWLSKVKAEVWDSCVDYAPHTAHERLRLKADNPYKESE